MGGGGRVWGMLGRRTVYSGLDVCPWWLVEDCEGVTLLWYELIRIRPRTIVQGDSEIVHATNSRDRKACLAPPKLFGRYVSVDKSITRWLRLMDVQVMAPIYPAPKGGSPSVTHIVTQTPKAGR